MKPQHLMTPESFFGFRLHLLVDPSALMAWTSNSMIIPPKTYTHWITIALWTNIPVSSHYYSTVVFPWFSHDFPTLLPLVFKHVRLIKISYCCLYPDISIKSTWAVKSSCLSDGAEGTLNASPPQKMNKWILSVAHMICQNKYNVGFTQCPKTIPNSTIKGWLSTIPSHRWFVALVFPDYSRYPFFI